MAKMEIKALDEYIGLLKGLEREKTQTIIEHSIYDGAAIVADEIKKEIDGLMVNRNPHKGVSKEDKEDLKRGFGIAPMQFKSGEHNVKIGFDGYGHKTNSGKYPKGVPIPLIARSIISGTSFRTKNDFVRRAVNRVKKKAIEKMDETINEEFKKEMK